MRLTLSLIACCRDALACHGLRRPHPDTLFRLPAAVHSRAPCTVPGGIADRGAFCERRNRRSESEPPDFPKGRPRAPRNGSRPQQIEAKGSFTGLWQIRYFIEIEKEMNVIQHPASRRLGAALRNRTEGVSGKKPGNPPETSRRSSGKLLQTTVPSVRRRGS